jgi:hypothetical protein
MQRLYGSWFDDRYDQVRPVRSYNAGAGGALLRLEQGQRLLACTMRKHMCCACGVGNSERGGDVY